MWGEPLGRPTLVDGPPQPGGPVAMLRRPAKQRKVRYCTDGHSAAAGGTGLRLPQEGCGDSQDHSQEQRRRAFPAFAAAGLQGGKAGPLSSPSPQAPGLRAGVPPRVCITLGPPTWARAGPREGNKDTRSPALCGVRAPGTPLHPVCAQRGDRFPIPPAGSQPAPGTHPRAPPRSSPERRLLGCTCLPGLLLPQ